MIALFEIVADSCFLNNECEQECTNIMDGDFVCSCLPGFVLNEDGRTCSGMNERMLKLYIHRSWLTVTISDIDECEVAKGGCEFECNNTAGSYECVCDEGFALRADGHTCGIQCYVCDRATSNEECNQIEVCPPNAVNSMSFFYWWCDAWKYFLDSSPAKPTWEMNRE